MVLSKAQKQDAYREAQQIMLLADKWQELMPGERKPNFRRAAQEVLKRALGHRTARDDEALDIHGGLMHEHGPREARLIERWMRSGAVHPDVLHSFQHGITTVDTQTRANASADVQLHPDDPDVEVYVHDSGETIHYPSHYEPGTGTYHSSVHAPEPFAREVLSKQADVQLPSTYEAVH